MGKYLVLIQNNWAALKLSTYLPKRRVGTGRYVLPYES
jgi:hypothetical protein